MTGMHPNTQEYLRYIEYTHTHIYIYMFCICWSGQHAVASRCTLHTSEHYNVLFQTWGTIIAAYAILETAFVNEAKPRMGVLKWFESFGEGHENLHNGPSSGQRSTDRNPTIVSKLRELVDKDRQINLKLGGGGNLHINWKNMCQNTRKDLRNSQVSVKFVRQRCHNLWKLPPGRGGDQTPTLIT